MNSSKMADIYKQAHDLVLKDYQEEPEDRWKVDAIARSRAGEKGHESTMFQFVKDVESKVDKLLVSEVKSPDSIPVTVAPAMAPNHQN